METIAEALEKIVVADDLTVEQDVVGGGSLQRRRLVVRQVDFHDPLVETLDVDGEAVESVPMTIERLEGADAVVIATDHSELDYELLASKAGRVVDTRNAIRNRMNT